MLFQKGNKLCVGRTPWNKGIKYSMEMKKRLNLSGLDMTGFHGRHTEKTKIKFSIQRKGKKWSENQRINIIKNLPKGENHWNWQGGIANRDIHSLNNPQYKKWRMEVFVRDNFKCRIMDENCQGILEVHHILRWSEFPELRYKINNGITLCHFHHPRKKEEEKRLSSYFQNLVSVSGEL